MIRDWGTYRKLFEHLSPAFERLPFAARSVSAELLRRCDRLGRIIPADGWSERVVTDLVFHLRAHPGEENFIREAVGALLADGYLAFVDGFLTIRNFVKAQRSDSADRVAAHRAKQSNACNVTSVTGVTSRNETRRDETKDQPPVVPPAGGRPKRRAPKVPIPESWAPNAAHAEKAAKLGLNLSDQAQRFRNNAEGKDVRWVDWDKAFHNWLAQAPEFAPRGPAGKAPGQTEHDRVQAERDAKLLEEIRRGDWGERAKQVAMERAIDLRQFREAIQTGRVKRVNRPVAPVSDAGGTQPPWQAKERLAGS